MCKRIMVGMLAIMMMGMTASSTWAANTFSLNMMAGGESENNGVNYDLSQINLGLTVPLDNKLSFSGDFATGDIERNNYQGDTSSYKLKGAYRVYSEAQVRLALTGGLYHRDVELPAYYDYSVSSLIFGMDGQIKLDKRAWFDVGLALGLISDETLDYYGSGSVDGNPSSLLLFNLKFNYLINKQVGLSVGYVSESYNSEVLFDDNGHSGLTVGAFFRF